MRTRDLPGLVALMLGIASGGCMDRLGTRTDAGAPPVHAAAGGRAIVTPRSTTGDRIQHVIWRQDLDFVHLERAEPGAPAHTAHPIALTPAQVRSALARLRLRSDESPSRALFSEAGLEKLARPLAEALAEADPEQEVTFAIVGERGPAGLLAERGITTGRLFFEDQRLNLILGLSEARFEHQLRATGYLRLFAPGTREKPLSQHAVLEDAALVVHPRPDRPDWVAIAPDAWQFAADRQPVPTEPAVSPRVPQAHPVPAVLPRPASPATPPEPGHRSIEQRLETLRRLHERALITEDEYRQKRQEILDEL